MRAIILLALLATIVLFACNKEQKEPDKYCTFDCADPEFKLAASGYGKEDLDTVVVRFFEEGNNFAEAIEEVVLYNPHRDTIARLKHKDCEVSFISTGDVFRIYGITYSSETETIICPKHKSYPCDNKVTSITVTRNGLPVEAQHSPSYHVLRTLYLGKP